MGIGIVKELEPGQALQAVLEERQSLRSILQTTQERLSEVESMLLEQKELLDKLQIFRPLLLDNGDKLPFYIRDREVLRQAQGLALKLHGRSADVTIPDKSQAASARKVVDMVLEACVQFVIYNNKTAFERWYNRDKGIK